MIDGRPFDLDGRFNRPPGASKIVMGTDFLRTHSQVINRHFIQLANKRASFRDGYNLRPRAAGPRARRSDLARSNQVTVDVELHGRAVLRCHDMLPLTQCVRVRRITGSSPDVAGRAAMQEPNAARVLNRGWNFASTAQFNEHAVRKNAVRPRRFTH